MVNRFVAWGVVSTVSFSLWGCGGPANPKARDVVVPSAGQQQPNDAQAEPSPQRKVDQMDADAGGSNVDALARKTEAHAREVGELMNKRPPAAPPEVPSAVKWMDPEEFSIGAAAAAGASRTTLESGKPNQTGVRPVVETGPIASNQPGVPALGGAAQVDSRPPPAHALVAINSDALAEKLSRRIKEYPRDTEAHLEYQMLHFLLDDQTPQLAALSPLPSEDRELITTVLDGFTNLRNALRADNNMLLSKKIKPILEAGERLRSQAELTIPTIALCTRVNTFGSYDPIDPARFPANPAKDNQAIVYCEVENFTSNLNDRQLWETRLTWDMTLYTDQGIGVWSDKTENIVDATRSRRHDFFVRKLIGLPRTLTIGRYLLKVTIVDTQSNRVAEANIPLVIAAN